MKKVNYKKKYWKLFSWYIRLRDKGKCFTCHLKKHPKDNHSRRGLLKMVAKRKKMLDYLKDEDEKRYKKIIKSLELKNK